MTSRGPVPHCNSHPTSNLSTVGAMTDMTSSLFAEQVVVVDFDGNGFT